MIKWGIFGTGNIANAFASDFKAVNSGELAGVASRNRVRAKEFAAEYNIPNSYEGYKNLVKNKEIDIVYIATPHAFHYENIMLCLENDISVFCEKPLTVNYQQAQEAAELAAEKDLLLLEAMWTYYLPAIKKVKEWIANGQIGKVKMIEAEFGFRNEIDPDSRLFNLDLAGGALLDVGIYPIALANLIENSAVKNVLAEGRLGSTGVDEDNAALLKFESGTLAQLSSSLRTELEDEAVIYGTKGQINIPDFWRAEKAVLEADECEEVFEDKRDTTGYNYEAEAVSKLLLEGQEKRAEKMLELSLENMRILDEIRKQLDLEYPFE
ncbi:Gfo/Idh/MocA family protein [Halanaerobacter jeridensis]|uniref:Dehydrogenase n=1 Tax=Halanaerobacter jeridensis TaxID=706427 RepID=A0A938XR44_9FIRM|nr:Gfo/Idh/MocA family oxidoreductase [Halanaerobacter jeridensis]MBM7556081.1 putative dehydrogenase [Halanaerobacter jeridensis]